MNHVELYLEKFKTIGGEDFALKKQVVDVIKKHTNIEVEEEGVVLQKGVIRVSLSGIERTEFALKKEAILKDLKTNLSLN